MPRKIPRLLWLAIPLAYAIYLHGLSATGLIGPDEPRYAFISRAMTQTGDWITPRLWSSAWFEKPPLLYWMEAAAFRIGVPDDLAPRLPVALLALAFLVFYWWILRREFGCRVAWIATLILGTSGMWVGYSHAGVTDVPLTACFASSILLALPWVARRETGWLPLAAALFGAAMLAKGLVPLALAAPLVLGRYVWDWLRPRVILPFLLVAAPWYLLCYARNGWPFIHEFFVVQHFSRVTSEALQHVQPKWYYLPILPAALLPWTPLLFLGVTRDILRDRRNLFLLVWSVWTFLVFSVAINKLAGYVLPAMPALAALLAIRLDQVRSARWVLALCGALTVAFPIAARLLPAALVSGISHAPRPQFEAAWLVAAAAVVAAWMLDNRKKRLAAVAAIAVAVGIGIVQLTAAAGSIDAAASARGLGQQIALYPGQVCLGDVKRNWDYGLAYYAGARLPDCHTDARAWEVAPVPPDGAVLRPKP
jgi:4-amino-4-deoxy-L-arabinose transferase-like glycosyltransferase